MWWWNRISLGSGSVFFVSGQRLITLPLHTFHSVFWSAGVLAYSIDPLSGTIGLIYSVFYRFVLVHSQPGN